MYKLSILIPTLKSRTAFLERLERVLSPQLTPDVQVIKFMDNGEASIGAKRNWLLDKAAGEYLQFLDDDDLPSKNYIALQMPGINAGVDCCSLRGIITEDGANPLVFEHSIKYKEYKTNTPDKPVRYERFPNHLNCIKSSIAKQFRFPEKNHGEDTDWATQLHKSGLLRNEYEINEILYYYEYRSKK